MCDRKFTIRAARPAYEVSFRKEHKGDSHFVKVGVAFEEEKGRVSVVLDSLPIGWDGRLTLFPQGSLADERKI